jgi:hypothetical protein
MPRLSPHVSAFDHFVRYPTRFSEAARLLEQIEQKQKKKVEDRELLEELHQDLYNLGGFDHEHTFRAKYIHEWHIWENAMRPFKPEILDPQWQTVFEWAKDELRNLFRVRWKIRGNSVSRALRFVRALDAALMSEIEKTYTDILDYASKAPANSPLRREFEILVKSAQNGPIDPKARQFLKAVRRNRVESASAR